MRPVIFFALFFWGFTWKTAGQQPVKESYGVYRFLDDEPGRRGLQGRDAGVAAQNGMVASAHPVASAVGAEILRKGGNVIDAAVAVKFALAVVHPAAGNVGGGGFLLYRDKSGNAVTLDFREKAPAKSHKDMYLDREGNPVEGLSLRGALASGVPGSVAGIWEAHRKYGSMSWSALIQPAIDIARQGVVLTGREARGLNAIRGELDRLNPGSGYYRRADGKSWEPGDTLRQAELAATLRRIQVRGRNGFYKGRTARLLVRQMRSGGGIISRKDLRRYAPRWRAPVTGSYRGNRIITMGPPSSGGIALVQLLRLSEAYPFGRWGWSADSTIRVMIEAERRVYADRATYLGDPDFVKVPVAGLVSQPYLDERWKDFSFEKASESRNIRAGSLPGYESSETTHFSIADRDGNAVAVTTTLNGSYGSGWVVRGGGFLLNNEMDDFSIKPGVPNMFGLVGNRANAIAPGKRMLSSMTPTILERDGKLFMVVGTPGGSTIITSVYQTILNVVDHGMTMQEAVNAFKFHHQWLPDKTVFEQGRFSDAVLEKLQQGGYILERQKGTIGRMDCIMIRPDGTLEGASDPRGDNTSAGF